VSSKSSRTHCSGGQHARGARAPDIVARCRSVTRLLAWFFLVFPGTPLRVVTPRAVKIDATTLCKAGISASQRPAETRNQGLISGSLTPEHHIDFHTMSGVLGAAGETWTRLGRQLCQLLLRLAPRRTTDPDLARVISDSDEEPCISSSPWRRATD
jgi:hypothetical protein